MVTVEVNRRNRYHLLHHLLFFDLSRGGIFEERSSTLAGRAVSTAQAQKGGKKIGIRVKTKTGTRSSGVSCVATTKRGSAANPFQAHRQRRGQYRSGNTRDDGNAGWSRGRCLFGQRSPQLGFSLPPMFIGFSFGLPFGFPKLLCARCNLIVRKWTGMFVHRLHGRFAATRPFGCLRFLSLDVIAPHLRVWVPSARRLRADSLPTTSSLQIPATP